MNSFRNGETPTEAYVRIKNEMNQDRINKQKEKEMEDRIFERVMKRIHVAVLNEAKTPIKELNELIKKLGKGDK